MSWLDFAIARSPGGARLRWARLARRLTLGRIEDAMADAEHLEAQAQGPRARHDVWTRAGATWQRAGLRAEAGPLFERALRIVPDDTDALAGLGRALLAQGRIARAVALLTRAMELADRSGVVRDATLVDLARALAEKLEDRPAAIARIRGVRSDSAQGIEARALEGRWRGELGDLEGASFAYARLRDLVAAMADSTSSPRKKAILELMMEAAAFERDRKRDLLGAQRHLAVAIGFAPQDAAVGSAYREVGAELAGVPDAPRGEEARATTEDDDESRVEELTRHHHANPHDDAVVDELAARLMRLGRTHETFALLSGRLEDASPERRTKLIPAQQAVLESLEKDARARGQDAEARLFADARAQLDP